MQTFYLNTIFSIKVYNMLSSKFKTCSDNVKTILFRSYCTALYTPQLWWSYSVENMRKLKVAYNTALRLLLRLPSSTRASQLFVTRNLPTFFALIRNKITRFMSSLYVSQNLLIINIMNSDIVCLSHIWKHWIYTVHTHIT